MLPRRYVCVARCLGVPFGSWCRWWLRVLLMCSQLVPLSCLAAGDSAPLGGASGGDQYHPAGLVGTIDVSWIMRAVGWLGASFALKLRLKVSGW